jgi:hypothetical protein
LRYLTLAADYTQSALRDDFIGSVVPEEVGISDTLSARIRAWNTRYRAVIPLHETQRVQSPTTELIDALDEEGRFLAKEIAAESPEFKVRYFSEGRLRYDP